MIKNIKVKDTVIFKARWGEEDIYDGEVLSVDEKCITVGYLYDGYKSGTDKVLLEDIIAKVDLKVPSIELKNAPYTGHFIEYLESNDDTPFKDLQLQEQLEILNNILSGTIYKTTSNGYNLFIDYKTGYNLNLVGTLAYEESSIEEMLECKAKELRKEVDKVEEALSRR